MKKDISFFRSSKDLFSKNPVFDTPDQKNTIFTISVPYFCSLPFRKFQNRRSAYNDCINVQHVFFKNFWDFWVNFLTQNDEKMTQKNDHFDGIPEKTTKNDPKTT
jgi:hypothetical protein